MFCHAIVVYYNSLRMDQAKDSATEVCHHKEGDLSGGAPEQFLHGGSLCLLGGLLPDWLCFGHVFGRDCIEPIAERLNVCAELVLPHRGDVIWSGYVFQVVIEETSTHTAETVPFGRLRHQLNDKSSTNSSPYSESSSSRLS